MNLTPDIEAYVTLFTPENGGRKQAVKSGYRPHHKVLENYHTSGVHQYIDTDSIAPGESARATITFLTPEAYPHCLWIVREITVQEGSRVVGSARVTKIMNPLLERKTE